MGLDAVELVLRTEEFFVISIGDDEAASVRTVGDFYNLICTKLDVLPLQRPVTPINLPIVTEKEKVFLFLQKQTPLGWRSLSAFGKVRLSATSICYCRKLQFCSCRKHRFGGTTRRLGLSCDLRADDYTNRPMPRWPLSKRKKPTTSSESLPTTPGRVV
jgi:hypothetical protein